MHPEHQTATAQDEALALESASPPFRSELKTSVRSSPALRGRAETASFYYNCKGYKSPLCSSCTEGLANRCDSLRRAEGSGFSQYSLITFKEGQLHHLIKEQENVRPLRNCSRSRNIIWFPSAQQLKGTSKAFSLIVSRDGYRPRCDQSRRFHPSSLVHFREHSSLPVYLPACARGAVAIAMTPVANDLTALSHFSAWFSPYAEE